MSRLRWHLSNAYHKYLFPEHNYPVRQVPEPLAGAEIIVKFLEGEPEIWVADATDGAKWHRPDGSRHVTVVRWAYVLEPS